MKFEIKAPHMNFLPKRIFSKADKPDTTVALLYFLPKNSIDLVHLCVGEWKNGCKIKETTVIHLHFYRHKHSDDPPESLKVI